MDAKEQQPVASAGTCGFNYETGQPPYSPFCKDVVPGAAQLVPDAEPAPVELYASGHGGCPPGQDEGEHCK